MTIAVEFHGMIAIIVLLGSIDYSTQEEMRNAINKVLSSDQVAEIHVNFSDVTFMDSSGIRALLVLQKKGEETGKSLVLINCSTSILELFEIGGFDHMFTII